MYGIKTALARELKLACSKVAFKKWKEPASSPHLSSIYLKKMFTGIKRANQINQSGLFRAKLY